MSDWDDFGRTEKGKIGNESDRLRNLYIPSKAKVLSDRLGLLGLLLTE